MTTSSTPAAFGKWMALIAALLGWMFDGLEMGLFPLVQRPALRELVGAGAIEHWQGIITSFFLVGAATGGVLFGWLGDRVGRVRAMMLSVLTYALVSALCGFANSAWQIGVLRFVAALGMGGEWALGVALIAEIWPNRSRAFLAGLIGAAGNVGYLIIAVVGLTLLGNIGETRDLLLSIGLSEDWTDHLLRNQGWRLLMMFGAAPALLTFLIRIFVPESEKWEHEKAIGSTSQWQTRDLLAVLVGAFGACGIIAVWAIELPSSPVTPIFRVVGTVFGLAITLWGYTYPITRYLERTQSTHLEATTKPSTRNRMILAACLSGVALLGTWGTVQQAPSWADKKFPDRFAKEYTQIVSACGAVVGTVVAALLGGWLGRRITYFFFCIASLIMVRTFFLSDAEFGNNFLLLAFGLGAITASFYGWLPLYLPELFRTSVRATGQGFGFNFGRILAAIGVLQLGPLTALVGDLAQVCAMLGFVYLLGLILIWFVPETKGQPLPE